MSGPLEGIFFTHIVLSPGVTAECTSTQRKISKSTKQK